MISDIEMKQEPTIVSTKVDPMDLDQSANELNEDEDEDPVVNEIDIFHSKSLANNIYILQVKLKNKNKIILAHSILN
jgi:hypothetical protein